MIEASLAERMRFRLLSWIAFGGVVLVGAQLGVLLVRGEPFCLNEGCKIVEGLTRIPPLYFNLFGFGWFSLATAVLRRAVRRPWYDVDWPRILLLGGLAVEAVLFGYQLFVARAFCAYCLAVFALVLALNLLAGRDQALRTGAVLGSSLLMFSLVRFGVSGPAAGPGARALDAGTYAVRRCSDPAKQLYLIFSSTCPHCQDVIRTLENCNSCNFHFNPIDRLESFDLAGSERTASYRPRGEPAAPCAARHRGGAGPAGRRPRGHLGDQGGAGHHRVHPGGVLPHGPGVVPRPVARARVRLPAHDPAGRRRVQCDGGVRGAGTEALTGAPPRRRTVSG